MFSIHVAGNSVLDLLLRDVPFGMGRAEDAWGSGNVHFLSGPPEAVLGGNGGATAYLLGRLGERVSLNSRVGTDAFGKVLRGWLEGDAGVTFAAPPAKTTAVNVIPISPGGERRSIYYTGEKVDWRQSLEDKASGWFFASGYGQVTAEDLVALTAVFGAFQSRGVRVAFDPGPWFFLNANRKQMLAAWACVDCLIGTEDELSTWHVSDRVEGLIEKLLECGPGQVAVKRGGDGAAFGSREGGIEQLATERVKGVNTVGAGDTFNAGLLHGLAQGETLEEAVRIGMRLATQAVRNGRGVLGALEL